MASYGAQSALRHVSIGQYIPTGSVVHRLDPRAKLIALLVIVLAVVVATSYTANAFLLCGALALVLLARLPIRYILSSVIPALPFILILSLFQLLFYGNPSGDAHILLSWGAIRITTAAVRLVIVSLARFLDLLLLTSLLTNTTTTSALTQGLESLLRPFNVLGLPGHELALVGAIALRFVPILGEQLDSILQAQASRGVGTEATGRWNLARNTRRIATLIIPLFVDAYRRSEELTLAMRARCYHGGRGRTHLIDLHFTPADYMATVLALATLATSIVVQHLHLP